MIFYIMCDGEEKARRRYYKLWIAIFAAIGVASEAVAVQFTIGYAQPNTFLQRYFDPNNPIPTTLGYINAAALF